LEYSLGYECSAGTAWPARAGPSHGYDLKRVLLADHAIYRLEADLRWIDHTAARLDLLARAVR
jgi:hypothetical protein